MALSECVALVRHRLSFERIGWHMILTAVVVRACVRAIIVGIGVRRPCKGGLIMIVELIASKILRVWVVAR